MTLVGKTGADCDNNPMACIGGQENIVNQIIMLY